MDRSSSDITSTWGTSFLEPTKLECNSGHAKQLALEYVILICISVIIQYGVWDVSLCDCGADLYCGRKADRR